MGTIALWLLRKALYTAVGTGLAIAATYLTAHPNFDGAALTGLVAGLGVAVFGDLRRALAPDFLQIVTGTDPRKDG